MTLTIGLTVGAIIGLLALSGFFSGSETALTATSRARMHQLEKKGDHRAKRVNRLIAARERLIGALLFGNNLVNILASALATQLLLELFGDVGVAYATLIMTSLVLVFAEVLPKTIALSNPDTSALRVSSFAVMAVNVFSPISRIVQTLVRFILWVFRFGLNKDAEMLSAHDELRGAIAIHHRDGAVVKVDHDMLGGILDMKDLEISDIMVHRTNLVSVCADDPVREVISSILSSTFTRVPLWTEKPENFIGVLHTKDLAQELVRAGGNIDKIDIKSLATPPWFVPETTPLQSQLNAFLRRRVHLAFVVDEYGEVLGLLTLEDILEEIVGEIADEHDIEVEGVRPQPNGSLVVDGEVPVRDLNRAMDWSLPEDEATTIAGLVIHEAQIIPEVGQAFTFYGFKFEVLRKQRNQLTSIRLTPVTLVSGKPNSGKPPAIGT